VILRTHLQKLTQAVRRARSTDETMTESRAESTVDAMADLMPDKAPPSSAKPSTLGLVSGSTNRYLLGGLGDSRQMYALDDEWRVKSHRNLDAAGIQAIAQGTVIAADPVLDLARRIDHTVSERVQLAEFASDIGEPLMSVKTKARSGLTQLLGRKSKQALEDDDGETLEALQAIQERGWWLCTPADRFTDLAESVRVTPLASVMLKLLEAHSRDKPQAMDKAVTVVALVFPGVQRSERSDRLGDFQIVCLATFTAAGHFEGLDFVPGSGMSVEQIISNYVSVRRLNSEGLWPQERLVLASTADPQVKKWLAAAPFYPRQQLFLGLPAQKAASLATRLSAAALCTTVSYSAFAHYQLSHIQTDIAQAQAAQSQSRAQAIAQVRERSLGYVLTQSGLDTERAIDMAVKAWQPGSLVEMKATPERVTLTVSAALGQTDGSAQAGGPASSGASLVNAPAPEGCTRAPTQVNAAMNQLVITYECTLQNPGVERMRAAGF
jgi:hypothetical protein